MGRRQEPGAVIVLSCGIFHEEIRYLVDKKGLNIDVEFLKAALHVNFDRLREALVAALERHKEAGAAIKVVYGHCHPDMDAILATYGAQRITAGNCIEAMVGADEVRRINEEGTAFFLSAGWVNNWEEMFTLGKADFGFDFPSMFANYKRIVVFDSGVVPIDEEKVQQFSAFTKLPVERRHLSLDRLEELIRRLLPSA